MGQNCSLNSWQLGLTCHRESVLLQIIADRMTWQADYGFVQVIIRLLRFRLGVLNPLSWLV